MDLPSVLERFVPRSEVLFLNLKETPAEELVAEGYPLGWLLRVMQAVDRSGAELEAVLGEALEHLGRLPTEQREVLGKLLRFLVMLVYYRRELEEAQELAGRVDAVAREAKVEEMGRTAWQELIERGRQEGIERGRQEGLESMRATALDVLTAQFGSLPPEVTERVSATDDAERLRRLIHHAVRADSLDALTF